MMFIAIFAGCLLVATILIVSDLIVKNFKYKISFKDLEEVISENYKITLSIYEQQQEQQEEQQEEQQQEEKLIETTYQSLLSRGYDQKSIFYSLRINGYTEEEIKYVLGDKNEISNT